MKSKNTKYTKYIASIIIILGLLFICFIPLFFKADNSAENWPALDSQDNRGLSHIESQNKTGTFNETMRSWVIDPILGRNRYPEIDGELKKLFKEAEVIYLIDNIKLVEDKKAQKKYEQRKIYGTIVGIINKNNIPIRYKIGDQERIGDWFYEPNGAHIPEGAVLFLEWGPNYIHNAGNTVYFNYNQLGRQYNSYTFEYIKQIFEQYDKRR